MTEDQDAKDSQNDSGNKAFNKNKDIKKTKTHRPLTKIILRRLPPTMTEEAFLEQVSPIPEHDHFYFAKPDPSLGHNVYSRAYINFVNVEDIYLFRDKFDGYVFLDEKGVEYVGIVEYAPFQRIPKKKKKKDPKCGTIESDPIYQDFLENLNKDPETENQPKLEYSYPINDVNDKKSQSTPLLEYLAARKVDKRGRDERRRRENDKRKMRIERKTKDGFIKKSGDLSEDDMSSDHNNESKNKIFNMWFRENNIYNKNRAKMSKVHLDTVSTDKHSAIDFDSDSQFPALTMKTLHTFTISLGKSCDKSYSEDGSKNSGGDTHTQEEDDIDVTKIKSRDWDKEKSTSESKVEPKSENKDLTISTVFESKSYKEQQKAAAEGFKEIPLTEELLNVQFLRDEVPTDEDKFSKKEKKDKFKEYNRDLKCKKYSEARKERLRQSELLKSEKQAAVNKAVPAEVKAKTLNQDDIKPFTQLPQVKTEDLTKLIEGMDKKLKSDEINSDFTLQKEINEELYNIQKSECGVGYSKTRKDSVESIEDKEDLVSHKYDDRSKSTDREGSEEKEKNDSERRAERRIRNKDRPSLVIYQPGMGKFSKQRLAKEKDTPPIPTGKSISDSEKKDT